MAIALDDTLVLHKASRYEFPEDDNALLPRVYGSFLGLPFVHNDEDDGGFLPAVSINRLQWIFLLNDGPIPASSTVQIFMNDKLQDPSTYIFEPSIDYEGLGWPIAAIRFVPGANPATRKISWRGLGTADSSGVLITPVLNAIYHMFSVYGGWTLDDIDLPTTYESARTLDELGAVISWVFHQEKTYREWLVEILKAWFVDFWVNVDGKLTFKLDRPMWGLPLQPFVTVDAKIDLDGTEDDVEFEIDERNIVSVIEGARRYKWSTEEYTETAFAGNPNSLSLYGPLLMKIELPALYTDAHGLAWLACFFGRYGFLPAVVRFTTRGFGLLTALPGTYIGFLCSVFGWDTPRLLKVLNHDVDPTALTISFECFDCQRFTDETVALPVTALTAARSRVRTADSGVDLTSPAAASNLVSTSLPGRVVLSWTIPGDRDYAYTEVWSSTTNLRSTATLAATGYNSITYDGILPTTYYVWLMTVDRSLNGQHGTGNWHPASDTSGIPVIPAPVSTVFPSTGLIPAATYGAVEAVLGVNPVLDFALGGRIIANALVYVTLPAGRTFWIRIRENDLLGTVIGSAIYPNITTATVTIPLSCPGEAPTPSTTGVYVVTGNMAGADGLSVGFYVDGGRLVVYRLEGI